MRLTRSPKITLVEFDATEGSEESTDVVGRMASDSFCRIGSKDLDAAEQGVNNAYRKEHRRLSSASRSSSSHHSKEGIVEVNKDQSRSDAGPSSRAGIARMVNAAASAVEEYFDAEELPDVTQIPTEDRFEGMRGKLDAFIQSCNASSENDSNRIPEPPTTRVIPGVGRSSVEMFNSRELAPQNQAVANFRHSPFSSAPYQNVNLRGVSLTDDRVRSRSIVRSDNPISIDSQDTQSFETIGAERARRELAPHTITGSLRPPLPHQRGRAGPYPPRYNYAPPPRQAPQIGQSYNPRKSFGEPPASQPSQNLGAIEEIREQRTGKLVRRRVALPWQVTATFGFVTCLGCLVGCTTLGIAIRNVIYLNGPKAGPQLPDIKEQLDLVLAILEGRGN